MAGIVVGISVLVVALFGSIFAIRSRRARSADDAGPPKDDRTAWKGPRRLARALFGRDDPRRPKGLEGDERRPYLYETTDESIGVLNLAPTTDEDLENPLSGAPSAGRSSTQAARGIALEHGGGVAGLSGGVARSRVSSHRVAPA